MHRNRDDYLQAVIILCLDDLTDWIGITKVASGKGLTYHHAVRFNQRGLGISVDYIMGKQL